MAGNQQLIDDMMNKKREMEARDPLDMLKNSAFMIE
jgi:hypothetical protein